CTDKKGRFYALIRNNLSGIVQFYYYLRTSKGKFSKIVINTPRLLILPYLAYCGKIVVAGNNLIAILPN
ncbi:hypothetical protein BDU57DRAFT_440721, partial [Ampelomyces quisqualis]